VSEIRFDGRTVVVTGAGSGLGRAHARLLASRGAHVVVNDLAESAAADTVSDITSSGGTASVIAADVSTEDGAASVIDHAMAMTGRVDALVNNAGLLRAADFDEMTFAVFEMMVRVNLFSVFHMTKAAWPHMRRAGYGRVVSTTSNSGLLGTAGSTGYASAKAAIWGLTRSLALEGGPHGINVNAIAPVAFTPTSMQSRVAPPSWRSGEGDPWARQLDPARVSPVAAWLVHHGCRLNGVTLSSAGGMTTRFSMTNNHGFDIHEVEADDITVELVRDMESTLVDPADRAVEHENSSREGRAIHHRLMRRGST